MTDQPEQPPSESSKYDSSTMALVGVIGAGIGAYAVSQSYKPIKTTQDLGVRVREARKAMGLPQQTFADLSGVGRRFLSELEAGKPTLEFGRVLKVCSMAGIDLFSAQRTATQKATKP